MTIHYKYQCYTAFNLKINMKKNIRSIFIASSLLFFPLFSNAQIIDTNSTSTQNETEVYAHIFTTCSQTAIETRDTSITAARSIYNVSMAKALNERKEKEKAAVAILDDNERKDAIKDVVEDYRKSSQSAQEILTASRKVTWDNFERDIQNCRESKVESMEVSTTTSSSTSAKNLTTNSVASKISAQKELITEKDEPKSFKESILSGLEAIKSLFIR